MIDPYLEFARLYLNLILIKLFRSLSILWHFHFVSKRLMSKLKIKLESDLDADKPDFMINSLRFHQLDWTSEWTARNETNLVFCQAESASGTEWTDFVRLLFAWDLGRQLSNLFDGISSTGHIVITWSFPLVLFKDLTARQDSSRFQIPFCLLKTILPDQYSYKMGCKSE